MKMQADALLPGRGLFWALVLVQGLVLAPHLLRVPIWTGLFWLLCVGWRSLAFRRDGRTPAGWLKAVLVLLAAVMVAVEYGLSFSLEPAVAMLLLAFALKLLELRQRRDVRVLLLLAYFVLGAQFLYEQSMTMAAYQVFAFTLVTAAIIALQRAPGQPLDWRADLGTAGLLVAQALPLTVLMFVFFPRIEPLWAVPLPDAGARTGLSESMTPGDIARLGRSEALAFRVDFERDIPPYRRLYWRVMTYSHYQGGTWSQGRVPDDVATPVVWLQDSIPVPGWLAAIEPTGESIAYSVLAEPSQQPWLVALDVASPRAGRIGLARDFRVLHDGPVTQRIRYALESTPSRTDLARPGWLDAHALQLPASGNPETRAWGGQLQREHLDASVIAQLVLEHFTEQPFHYTLSPPRLGEDDIDAFLFETQRGFCAHFAGAFVFLMRAAGIPARVVAGYHGGELNPVGSHWLIRQADAHAWAEFWLPGAGWVQVDPTAAVAPDRIELGRQEYRRTAAVSAGGSGGDEAWWRQGALQELYFLLDMLEHRWNLFVLDYDGQRQLQFLQQLLGQVTPGRVVAAVSVGMLVTVLWVLLLWWPAGWRQRRSEVGRLQARLWAYGRRLGLPCQAGESPSGYGRRLALDADPAAAAALRELGDGLQQALYDPASASAGVTRARLAWRRLRRHRWLRKFGATEGDGPL